MPAEVARYEEADMSPFTSAAMIDEVMSARKYESR